MVIINCTECAKEISDKASACPHCGYARSEASRQGLWAVCLSVFSGIFFLSTVKNIGAVHIYTFGDTIKQVPEGMYIFIWIAIGLFFILGISAMTGKRTEASRHCKKCERPQTRKINMKWLPFHLVLCLLTIGLWLPVWLVLALKYGWECRECDDTKSTFMNKSSVSLGLALGATIGFLTGGIFFAISCSLFLGLFLGLLLGSQQIPPEEE